MDSGFKMELVLEYNKVFIDHPNIDDLLSGISRSTLLKLSTFFLGFDNQNSDYQDPKKFISMFFQAKNNAFANDVYDKIKAYQKSAQAAIIIPSAITSLTLFEYAFKNLDETETLSEAEMEINIFKAYLLINEQHANKAKKAKKTVTDVKDEPYLSELIFTMSYADSDLMNFNPRQLFMSQIVKSIMLFEMLEGDERAAPLLQAFLSYFECKNWKDYIKRLLPAVFPCILKRNEAHVDIILNKDENYENIVKFFDKLIISDDSALVEHDFTSIRANPIYQVDQVTYRIVFPLFAIEMLHKGLYFKLADINKGLEEGQISNLKGYYGENFSENYLLYKTMKRMYGKRYVQYTGQQMKDAGLEAEPDFYLRNGNKIFLFESKDVFIGAEIKASFDYGQLDKAIKEKFYFINKAKGKVGKKAILQLVNSVKNTLKKALIVDNQYNEKRVVIYPILITHHHQFDVLGLNNILKEWFTDEIKKLETEGYIINGVKQLTLINIDRANAFKLSVIFQDIDYRNQPFYA